MAKLQGTVTSPIHQVPSRVCGKAPFVLEVHLFSAAWVVGGAVAVTLAGFLLVWLLSERE